MIDLGTYLCKYLNIGEIKPEEQFTDAYVEEVYKTEHVHTATKRFHVVLYDKYKKIDLYQVMETQCQHLTTTQHNDSLKLLQRFEQLFNGTLVTWKIDPVYFELREDADPVFSRP